MQLVAKTCKIAQIALHIVFPYQETDSAFLKEAINHIKCSFETLKNSETPPSVLEIEKAKKMVLFEVILSSSYSRITHNVVDTLIDQEIGNLRAKKEQNPG